VPLHTVLVAGVHVLFVFVPFIVFPHPSVQVLPVQVVAEQVVSVPFVPVAVRVSPHCIPVCVKLAPLHTVLVAGVQVLLGFVPFIVFPHPSVQVLPVQVVDAQLVSVPFVPVALRVSPHCVPVCVKLVPLHTVLVAGVHVLLGFVPVTSPQLSVQEVSPIQISEATQVPFDTQQPPVVFVPVTLLVSLHSVPVCVKEVPLHTVLVKGVHVLLVLVPLMLFPQLSVQVLPAQVLVAHVASIPFIPVALRVSPHCVPVCVKLSPLHTVLVDGVHVLLTLTPFTVFPHPSVQVLPVQVVDAQVESVPFVPVAVCVSPHCIPVCVKEVPLHTVLTKGVHVLLGFVPLTSPQLSVQVLPVQILEATQVPFGSQQPSVVFVPFTVRVSPHSLPVCVSVAVVHTVLAAGVHVVLTWVPLTLFPQPSVQVLPVQVLVAQVASTPFVPVEVCVSPHSIPVCVKLSPLHTVLVAGVQVLLGFVPFIVFPHPSVQVLPVQVVTAQVESAPSVPVEVCVSPHSIPVWVKVSPLHSVLVAGVQVLLGFVPVTTPQLSVQVVPVQILEATQVPFGIQHSSIVFVPGTSFPHAS